MVCEFFLNIFKKFLFWAGNGPGVASFHLKHHFFQQNKSHDRNVVFFSSSFSHGRLSAAKRGVLFEIRRTVDY